MSRSKPRFLKFFDAIHEDYSISELPEELQACGDCGSEPTACHVLVAGAKGRKKGVDAVVIRLCDSCGSFQLTQIFTADYRGTGLDLSVLDAIAAEFRGGNG